MSYERSTYSGLEWLGDIGGLFDGLYLITKIFISPVVTFALHSKIMTFIFRLDKAGATEKVESDEVDRKIPNLSGKFERIASQSFIKTLICQKRSKYKKMLKLTKREMIKQMDLIRYLKLQRTFLLSLLVALNPA